MLIVIEGLLEPAEVDHYRRQLQDAAWRDGLHSAGGLNALSKKNRQVDPACPVGRSLGNELLKKMGHHPVLVSATLPHAIFPPVFNRYGAGETYGAHVDAAVMQIPQTREVLRSDVSMTVFLSASHEYQGGELEIEGEFGAQQIKLEAGDAVVYPSSSLHRVVPVQEGERLAAITWIQSMVRETQARALLYDLDQSIQALTRAGSDQAELLRLTSVYHNLIRRMARI